MGEYRADGGNKLITGPDAMKEMRYSFSDVRQYSFSDIRE